MTVVAVVSVIGCPRRPNGALDSPGRKTVSTVAIQERTTRHTHNRTKQPVSDAQNINENAFVDTHKLIDAVLAVR